jgi:ankyrin repeat protein
MVRIYRIPTKELEEAFPLAQYCARYWITFAAVAESKDEILQGFIRAFFCYHRSSYRNCYSLYRPDQPAQRGEEPASALYYASFGGLINTVKYLLSQGANVNAQGGEYGNALQAASCGGHDRIVELLLGQGVDVDAQGRVYGNALYAASVGGHDRTVELLLGQGADVNAQGGRYGNAASVGGHDRIVELLLGQGADVDAQGGWYGDYGNALQDAYFSVVLAEKAAEWNGPSKQHRPSFQRSQEQPHLTMHEDLFEIADRYLGY